MDPSSEAAMGQLAQQLGVSSDGTTLRSLLNPEQTAAYEAALAGLGVPAAAFDPLDPWMAGLTLAVLPLMQQGYDVQSGVDKVILSKSGDTAKDARLETAEFQLGIFDNLPQEQQVEFLTARQSKAWMRRLQCSTVWLQNRGSRCANSLAAISE